MTIAAEPPLRLLIDGAALVANWRWLQARSAGAACGAAVKADGYGLGAVEVVRRLADAGCRDFFVATWAEARALMPLGHGLSLSVLHGVRGEDVGEAVTASARPVLNSAVQVARWKAAGGGACDVMVDTGMNRLGLTPVEARSGLLDEVHITTMMSHLACADEPGHPLNERQSATFAALRRDIPADRYSLANSAGICLGEGYTHDLTRPGLALYGGIPVPEDLTQRVALSQVVQPQAQVLQLRDVRSDESVGYGATWTAKRDSRIAILNLGYADGYLRAFAAAGTAVVGDTRCPLVGRVSMDLIAVDVTEADIGEGEWVAVDYDLPVAARITGLSQYELLTGMGRRYQRRWS